jgi:hypothetical protein
MTFAKKYSIIMSTKNENQTPITPVQQQIQESSFLTHQSQQENFKDLDNALTRNRFHLTCNVIEW